MDRYISVIMICQSQDRWPNYLSILQSGCPKTWDIFVFYHAGAFDFQFTKEFLGTRMSACICRLIKGKCV